MDNSLDSVENDDKGVKLCLESKALPGAAFIQTRKWVSHSPKVNEGISLEERAEENVINTGQELLGISWNTTKDVFATTAAPVSPEFQTTKGNILRKVATIFEPLRFACRFVLVAKN